MSDRVNREVSFTLSYNTFQAVHTHIQGVQWGDLLLCVLMCTIFAIATFVQFHVISGIQLSPELFVIPGVMSALMSVVIVWLRRCLRSLQYEHDQNEFVRAQILVLNHRLKDLLNERTELLVHAQDQVALAQSRADVGAMAAGVIHDINNALMSLHLSWEFLKEAPPEELTELQMSIDAALDQAMNITHDFKFFLRPTGESYAEIVTILQKVTSFLGRSMTPHQRLSLHYEESVEQSLSANSTESTLSRQETTQHTAASPSGPIYVGMSEGQLTQIIMNLVVNARDALQGEAGAVTINVATTPTEVIMWVKDTGIGMSAEVQLRAFEPFYTTKPEGEGTGLGLHVLDQIIQRVGGRIEIESELTRGTTFTVTIPLISLESVGL